MITDKALLSRFMRGWTSDILALRYTPHNATNNRLEERLRRAIKKYYMPRKGAR